MIEDPRAIIAREPMHYRQVLTIAVATALNALDGFDVLSISFASPGIAKEWGISRAELGVVLSMELIGMGAGAFLLGMLADRIGRRPTILGCLAVMGAGMWMASTAGDVTTLSVYRLLTGLGIGGMLATTSAIVAETANARRRNLAVAVMAGGYPVGAVVGGSIASMLLARTGHWQSVFEFGSIMTLAFIPLALLMVPETTAWLYDKRPANALERINRNMARHGRAALSGLPAPAPRAPRTQFMQFFEHGMAQTTLMLIVIYFGHMMSFYFFIKWIPKVVVDMGFPPAQAGGVLVWANVGGALGSLGVSLLTQRFGVRGLVSAAMLASAVAITLFGSWPTTLGQLSIMAMGGGFFANAAIAGLYAVIAQSFPSQLRAGGTGLVIGMGRAGAALGPIVAGVLMAAGWPFAKVAMTMALGTLVAGLLLMTLRYRESHA